MEAVESGGTLTASRRSLSGSVSGCKPEDVSSVSREPMRATASLSARLTRADELDRAAELRSGHTAEKKTDHSQLWYASITPHYHSVPLHPYTPPQRSPLRRYRGTLSAMAAKAPPLKQPLFPLGAGKTRASSAGVCLHSHHGECLSRGIPPCLYTSTDTSSTKDTSPPLYHYTSTLGRSLPIARPSLDVHGGSQERTYTRCSGA